MKSNIFKILSGGLIVLLSSCEKEYTEPNSFSDAAWYSSQFQAEHYSIGINDFISFSDVSINPVSHKWVIDEGCFYLSSDLTSSDDLEYESYIKSNDSISNEKTVHVLFSNSGMKKVRLFNEFTDSVAFAKLLDDKFLLDTVFWVDVYDTIQAEVAVFKEGVEIPLSEDTIFVEAGGSLEFVDRTTIGRPTNRNWTVVHGATELTSSDSIASITFNRMGVYTAYFSSSRVGEYLPGDWDELTIPNPIKVVQSSKPFELTGDVQELENETIQMSFKGEFAPFLGKEDFFTVLVNGNEFAIESVTINAQDKSILDLKLKDPIYRSDLITVSFASTGSNIASVDNRPAISFSDQKVVMYDINLLSEAIYGFEDGGAGWTYLEGDADYEFTTERAASGDYSLKISRSANQGNVKLASTGETFNLESGKTYVFRYKIWVDPVTTGHAINLWLLPGWEQLLLWLDDSFPKGEWVNVEFDYKVNTDKIDQSFMIHPYEQGIYYFDDFYVNEKEVRPE